MSGRYGASSGSSSSDVDADPLQEVAGGAVEVGAGRVVLAGLLDQAAGEQRAHHAVDVDAADRRDPGPRDRLLVGDHGQRLQRRLGEPRLLAVEDEPLDDRGELLAGVVAPAAGDVAQLEAAALLVVLLGERLQRRGDLVDRVADGGGQRDGVQRLVGDHQHRLERGAQRGDGYVDQGLLASRRPRSLVGHLCSPGSVWARARSARLGRRAVELVGDQVVDVGVVVAGPPDGQLAQRRRPGRRRPRPRGTARAARGTAPPSSACPASRRTAPGTSSCRCGAAGRRPARPARARSTLAAWMWCRRDLEHRLGLERLGGERGELLEPDADQHLGQQPGEPLLQADRPRVPPRLPRQPPSSTRGDLLEGAVLQQPGEEQVARLEQREVLLVLDVALRQQPGGLEVEQGRGDEQERRGLLEVPLVACGRAPALTWAMNSSVTRDSATSVMSSLCLEIRLSSRSKGPSKLSSRTSKRRLGPASRRLARRVDVGTVIPRSAVGPGRCRRRAASKSASTSATASRTSRPRSTARPCWRRSASRACSMSSSSSEVT